ncbi:hypothetical protein HDU98_009092 [Podochytrium sp. JEL0797]|nr:hypothetical protein HDU98_009092 [Podochytrium sp. JEL0797]
MNFQKLEQQLGGLGGMLGGLLNKPQQQQQQQQQQYQQAPYPGQPQYSNGLPGQQPQPQQGYPQQPYQSQNPQQQLPPGWIVQWNQQYQRNFYVETSSGKSQWEAPIFAPPPGPPPPAFAAPSGPPPPSPISPGTPNFGMPSPNSQQSAMSPVQPQDTNLASYYNLNAAPAAPPTLQSPQQQQQQNLFVPANASVQHHSGIQMQPAVGTVDPTVAIALALSQQVPSLMKAPPAGANQDVLNGWKDYLRRIQDAQSTHTRAIRDYQVAHDRRVKDAHYQDKQHQMSAGASLLNGLSSGGSGRVFGYAVENQLSYSAGLKQTLDDAQSDYNRDVEHAHQAMNDAVESANRDYEDLLRRNA